MLRFFLFAGFLIGRAGSAAAPDLTPLSVLEAGRQCVAYRIAKQLLLVSRVKVVGKSCEVAAQVIPEVDDKLHIEISFPISSLKSGEDKRDLDVADLLQMKTEPELLYVSESFPVKVWRELAAKGAFSIAGKLRIGTSWTPLNADLVVVQGNEGKEIDGVARTTLKDVGIKPPKLGLGLFATVKNDLELHFHLLGSRVLGFDTLVGKP